MGFRFIPPTGEEIHEYFEKQKQKIFDSIKEAYILACSEAVNRARETDTYKDRTNNLRSSIGFALFFNGNIVHEDFMVSGKGTGGGGEVSFTTSNGQEVKFTAKAKDSSGNEGVKTGEDFAKFIAERHKTNGFVAVIVAGMHYALYVESMGYDVLTSSTLDFTKELKKHFEIINKVHGTNLGYQ